MIEHFRRAIWYSIKPNTQQKTYISTMLIAVAGTLMFTAWQFIIPTDINIPKVNIEVIYFTVTVSFTVALFGYLINKE